MTNDGHKNDQTKAVSMWRDWYTDFGTFSSQTGLKKDMYTRLIIDATLWTFKKKIAILYRK